MKNRSYIKVNLKVLPTITTIYASPLVLAIFLIVSAGFETKKLK